MRLTLKYKCVPFFFYFLSYQYNLCYCIILRMNGFFLHIYLIEIIHIMNYINSISYFSVLVKGLLKGRKIVLNNLPNSITCCVHTILFIFSFSVNIVYHVQANTYKIYKWIPTWFEHLIWRLANQWHIHYATVVLYPCFLRRKFLSSF